MNRKRLGAVKLKPCPFCGGEAGFEHGEYGGRDGLVEIFCQDCSCKIMRSHWPDDPKTSEELVKSAIETWNTRHGQSVNENKELDMEARNNLLRELAKEEYRIRNALKALDNMKCLP